MDFYDTKYSNYNSNRDLASFIDNEKVTWYREKKWDHYHYDPLDINVPRVTKILEACIGRPELTKWAASLGENFSTTRGSILATGTLAHAMIDDFILLGSKQDSYLGNDYAGAYIDQAENCYSNFVEWWFEFHNKGCKITPIAIERTITCPWYGGTVDFIANITFPNGMSVNYILDFKTSKQISFEYFLQTRMYMNATNLNIDLGYEKELPKIQGVGIIRVDKFNKTTEFVAADIFNDNDFFLNLDYSINAMLRWYYEQHIVKSHIGLFKKTFKNRETEYYGENK